MLRAHIEYRKVCDAVVLEYLQATDRCFLKREQIAQATDVTGRALDRVLVTLIEQGILARFHLVLEDGTPSDLKVLGVMPKALQYRGLAFMPRPGGGYILSEASSDVVSCYVSQRDKSEDYTEATLRSFFSNTCEQLSAALFPSLRDNSAMSRHQLDAAL